MLRTWRRRATSTSNRRRTNENQIERQGWLYEEVRGVATCRLQIDGGVAIKHKAGESPTTDSPGFVLLTVNAQAERQQRGLNTIAAPGSDIRPQNDVSVFFFRPRFFFRPNASIGMEINLSAWCGVVGIVPYAMKRLTPPHSQTLIAQSLVPSQSSSAARSTCSRASQSEQVFRI